MATSKNQLKNLGLILVIFVVCACSSWRLSKEQEHEASFATAAWLYDTYGVVEDRQVLQLIDRVTTRLSSGLHRAALEPFLSQELVERQGELPWQVFVLRIPEPNAFSVGSGVIFISEGLIRASQSEAELAAVISHEMAHQLLGHTTQAIEAAIVKSTAPIYSFSLKQEIEADTLGLQLMRIARYDPHHAVGAFSLAYRQDDAAVSSEEKDWRAKRAANIRHVLSQMELTFPTTANSREFNRVRSRL